MLITDRPNQFFELIKKKCKNVKELQVNSGISYPHEKFRCLVTWKVGDNEYSYILYADEINVPHDQIIKLIDEIKKSDRS